MEDTMVMKGKAPVATTGLTEATTGLMEAMEVR